MTVVSLDRPGLYFLSLVRRHDAHRLLRAQVDVGTGAAPRVIVLPAAAHTSYLVRTGTALTIEFGNDVMTAAATKAISVRGFGHFLSLRASDLLLRTRPIDEFEFVPLLAGSGPEGRGLARQLRLLARWGFGLGSPNIQATPAVFPSTSRASVQGEQRLGGGPGEGAGGAAEFALVLHLYYPFLWPEFSSALSALAVPFHLIVTAPAEHEGLWHRIRSEFPGAELVPLENRGRDIGPFVELLAQGRLDRWPVICKIHGKLSAPSGPRALLGDIWRRVSVFDLLGSNTQVRAILDTFKADRRVMMMGSGRFRIQAAKVGLAKAAGPNLHLIEELAGRLGLAVEGGKLDFYAGTMFWIRGEALAPLKATGLRLSDFPAGRGQDDGQLHHAVERIFGMTVASQGGTIADVPLRYLPVPWNGGAGD